MLTEICWNTWNVMEGDYMRHFFALALVVIMGLFCLCGCGGDGVDSESPTTATTESDTLVSNSDEQILTMLNDSYSDNGYWEYDVNENLYEFYDTSDMINGYLEYYIDYGKNTTLTSSWREIKTTFTEVASLIADYTDKSCKVGVVNPNNTNNLVLLITSEDGVVYDVFEEVE